MQTKRIFNLNLSVETISLYLLIEGFSERKSLVSTKELFKLWACDKELFKKGLKELEELSLITRIAADNDYNGYYTLVNDKTSLCAG